MNATRIFQFLKFVKYTAKKRLIEAHPGGQIGIESEEGKGTAVWTEFDKVKE